MTAYRFRCVEVLMTAILWSLGFIAPVYAASQTVGTTTNPGDVQIVVDDLGAVRFVSNDNNQIQDQWICQNAECSDLSNGITIAFNDGASKQFRTRFFAAGTLVTPVSNTKDGNKVITVYRLGSAPSDPLVTQEVILDPPNRLYDIAWTISIPSGGVSITSLQFVHGGDTNLLGNDYGYGTWDASSHTVSVRPDPNEGSGEMSLIGVTPPDAFEARNYTQVKQRGETFSLANVVEPATVDIGMALQWNLNTLSAGGSVTIRNVVLLNTTTDPATPTPSAGTPAATATPTRTSTPENTPTATATGTATNTPTSTISATPTETATSTVTPTITVTPTVTSTATPGFNSTPDPGIGGVAPPVFDGLAGGATSASRPILKGSSTIGGSVSIMIDSVSVGSAPVAKDGTFSFQVPSPLAVGAHEVKGKTVLSDGSESAYSLPVIITVRREAVLDFDGDGITDLTGHTVRGARTIFQSLLSTSSKISSASIDGWFPAPADYDGDGRWDVGAIGVANEALIWSIKPSGTGVLTARSFGSSGDIALVGCRFGDSGEYSLAVVKGRYVRYRTLTGRSRGAFAVDASDMGQVLGCGDVDGDGVDELIVSTRESRGINRVTAVNRSGKRRYVKNISRFVNAFIAREVESGAPVLGALRGTGRDSKSSELRALRGTFDFPIVQLPSSLDVASGTFVRGDGASLTSGITWQRRGTRDVLRLLSLEKTPTKVLKLAKGYRVTKPQDSRRVAGSRGKR